MHNTEVSNLSDDLANKLIDIFVRKKKFSSFNCLQTSHFYGNGISLYIKYKGIRRKRITETA